jgi:hypothetical protein
VTSTHHGLDCANIVHVHVLSGRQISSKVYCGVPFPGQFLSLTSSIDLGNCSCFGVFGKRVLRWLRREKAKTSVQAGATKPFTSYDAAKHELHEQEASKRIQLLEMERSVATTGATSRASMGAMPSPMPSFF